MQARQAVAEALRDHNTDLATRAYVAIAMGVLTSLLVYVFILVICFFFFCLSAAPWYLVGTVIFAVFYAVAWRACKRGVDPIDGIAPVDEDDFGAIKLATLATGFPLSPRHTVAGFAGIIMHGPASIIEGRDLLTTRLPDDEAAITAAANLLVTLLDDPVNPKGRPIDQVQDKNAALALARIGLAKLDRRAVLQATMKARDRLQGLPA